MNPAEITGAEYWANFWEWIADKAFIVVVIALAIEYLTGRWARPHREAIESARELQVAQLTKDAARLTTEGDEARAAIADANARALESKLALEKFKAPRSLNAEQQARISEKLKPFAPMKFDMSVITGDPEAGSLLLQIAAALEAAGWVWIEWNHQTGPFMTVYSFPGKPNVGQGGITVGVRIETHPDHPEFTPAATELVKSLISEEITVVIAPASEDVPNHDTIHIRIAKKP